ncbi:MAG: tryptophan synthase subunit alpha [Candidatus Sumerlaeaceae bacterium]
MSRISETFATLRGDGSRALIPYLTAGYPNRQMTLPLLRALVAGGADIIEVGVPFSDPIADGPTIQRASAEALTGGITLKHILQMVKDFRQESQVPIVLFGAYNPFLHFGLEKFAEAALNAGVDAVLIPDLPAEEADEVEPLLRQLGLDLIYLVAPTTPANRKAEICGRASGFIYYISLKGVTGARATLQYELARPLEEIRACTKLPVAVGFGISTPEQAALVAREADGVVVGSALIDVVTQNRDSVQLADKVQNFIRSLKDAIQNLETPAVR